MSNTKIKINISKLWIPTDKFTVRYRDINALNQNLLAKRIKEIAPQSRLRNNTTIEQIQEVLLEINPIIFGEETVERYYSNKTFNKNNANSLSGWAFRQLCKSIYKALCLKRNLTRNEKITIINLTTGNYRITRTFIEETMPAGRITEDAPQPLPRVEELGLNEIEQLTDRLQHRCPSSSERAFTQIGDLQAIRETLNN